MHDLALANTTVTEDTLLQSMQEGLDDFERVFAIITRLDGQVTKLKARIAELEEKYGSTD